jgi:N-methylhydantoinase A
VNAHDSATAPIRLSADVGGTFTDVAAFDETTGELSLGKTLTTPQRLVTGIENGVTKAGSRFQAARLFLHGTTVAVNTILERSGAKCALLTTQGFRDIYEIGREPTTCFFASTYRSSTATCGLRSWSGSTPRVRC